MFLRDLIRGFSMQERRPPVVVPARRPGEWPLDRPLLELAPGDALSIRDCVAGIQIFGASGSGKTSGSLALLARAMLRDSWGMLVLTTKPGEADQWVRWAESNGRGQDVVRIQPEGPHHFNFLDYLSRHPDKGAAVASNIGDMLMTLASHAKPKARGTETSAFFEESASQLATQAIHLLRAAGEPLTLEGIAAVISSSPNHPLELREPSINQRLVSQLIERATANGSPIVEQLCQYFLERYPNMNERTRGDVVSTLGAVIFRFTEPPFKDLIASNRGNNYLPELIDAGRVMILDAPVIRYQQAGRLYQIAFKYLVQQMVLRRPSADTTRPVAIFADEAQNFATHADYHYQAICRDFRGSTVYATQTIDNYLEAVGSEAAVEALLASLVTKVFHANAGRTNVWAEKLIASDWRVMESDSLNHRSDQNHSTSYGTSHSQQMHPQIPSVEFTRLRTGGPANGGLIDAIVFQPGRRFNQTSRPILRCVFQQGAR